MAWIELDNAVNVRDLGDLPTQGGGTIRCRRLVRSDNLQDLSPADIDRLVNEIGVTTVVDLRSTKEVAAEGPTPLQAVDAVRHVHLSMLPESHGMTDVASDALAVDRPRTADRPRTVERDPVARLTSYYLGYLRDRPDNVVAALRTIAEEPGTVLVHCAAGKDRTGVVVAMALTVADVPREVVVADYVATGERIERILDRLRMSPTYAADIDRRPPEEHRPRAASMEGFLSRLDADHGGVLGWLAEHDFGPGDAQRLRAKLLEV